MHFTPTLDHAMTSLGILGSLTIIFGYALADCECGYSIRTGPSDIQHVFTDLLENDFVHLNIMDNTTKFGEYGWAAQNFSQSAEVARGPYGVRYSVENVISDTIADSKVFKGSGIKGGDAGVNLVVKSDIQHDTVTVAEIATTDLNMFYGTFRAGIKVTDVLGTCSAFFWYQNDTQEIDIEFLSSQFNKDNGSFPVNLVLQTRESADAGYDASKTEDFKLMNLPFDPTTDFHEYRFDFLWDRVVFYADGEVLTEMNGTGVPTSPGHLLLSHWSNGNPGWSQGPPKMEATTTISYVKAYFNSSLATRQRDYNARCGDPSAPSAVCSIPDNDPTYFFSNEGNKTPNQTTYHQNHGGEVRRVWWSFLLFVVLASSIWAVGL